MGLVYQDDLITIYHGDCREILPQLSGISAVVTDPPYGLGFMSKEWDTFDKSQFGRAGSEGTNDLKVKKNFNILPRYQSEGLYQFALEWAKLLLDVCLPGAMLLSFGGTRTSHRIACAIEDAGWQIRDTIMWVYGSGFPKSLDISKAIDKNSGRLEFFDKFRQMLRSHIKEHKITQQSIINHFGSEVIWHWFGNSQPQIPSREKWADLKEFIGITNPDFDKVYENAEREIIGEREDFVKRRCKKEPDSIWNKGKNFGSLEFSQKQGIITTPATPEAKLWEGYGTALKPSYEPIILAMKPLDGTFANNALKHKIAGLNIDGCRVETDWSDRPESWKQSGHGKKPTTSMFGTGGTGIDTSKARFPANFIHDGSQEVMELFPDSKVGWSNRDTVKTKEKNPIYYGGATEGQTGNHYSDNSGSAARFFYCAKSSRRERDEGLEDMPLVKGFAKNTSKQIRRTNPDTGEEKWYDYKPDKHYFYHNNHPTVKPLALMTYLCKLVKMPEYNLILDPFSGSGSTLLACKKLGIPCIGIEQDEHYAEISAKRCKNAL